MRMFHATAATTVLFTAAATMFAGQVSAVESLKPSDRVSYDRTIVLPPDFLASGRVSVKVGLSPYAAWQPVKATIICSPVCVYVNPPENTTQVRVVNPRTKEATVYLVARVDPLGPLAVIPLSEIMDPPYPE